MKRLITITILALCLLIMPVIGKADILCNGYWWQAQTWEGKYYFTIGVMQGYSYGSASRNITFTKPIGYYRLQINSFYLAYPEHLNFDIGYLLIVLRDSSTVTFEDLVEGK